MKIVYLNPTGVLGGAERMLLDVMASTQAAAPEARLHLISAAEGPLTAAASALGARVEVLPMPPELSAAGDSNLSGKGFVPRALRMAVRGLPMAWAVNRYTRQLRRAIIQAKPTLIHSNGIKTHLLSCWTGIRETPIVWHVHDFFSTRPLMARMLRWTARKASAAIAISQAVADDARQVLGRLPVHVVYNAIDTDSFSPADGDGGRLDALSGLPPAEPGTLRIGLVSTYARWKGHLVFLQAAARCIAELPSRRIRFYIVGGPIYQTAGSQFSEAELRDAARQLQIADRLGFVGFQDSIAWVYRSLDIVVHASTQPEPFGRTIVEAMSCGKPVIVAQAGGAAELFTHQVDALGYPPGDAVALAHSLRQLIEDDAARQRIGESARAAAIASFSRERLGREVLAVYHSTAPRR